MNWQNSVIETYDVKTPGSDKEIQFLSGGNQQKVIIGRAMACKPKLLVFDEPTKGIDVGTKTEIYRLMKKLAEEEGIGIIMIHLRWKRLRSAQIESLQCMKVRLQESLTNTRNSNLF